jgi:hypothetical protein
MLTMRFSTRSWIFLLSVNKKEDSKRDNRKILKMDSLKNTDIITRTEIEAKKISKIMRARTNRKRKKIMNIRTKMVSIEKLPRRTKNEHKNKSFYYF